ncbi:putative DNA binding domain-containing protein [Candidatus Parcubacteria bacterium]|nr:putative DNA binding domain-containing protein [Candidatus Parcubacteria bacterium]
MHKKELQFILQEGEGQFVEFKESLDSKNLSKEIVSFANASGGKIYLGIADNGRITGIKTTNKLKSQIQDIANNCDPSIVIIFEEFANILIIEIKEGGNKPYSCSAGFFMRVGPNSQKMKRDGILEIVKNNAQFDFDSHYSKKKEDFNFDSFKYFLKKNEIGMDLDEKDVLKSMRLINFESDFSNASILLFGKNVQHIFPSAYLECVLFKDNANIIDRKRVNGNLFEQLEYGMIFLKKHLKVRYEFPDELRREIYDVPLRALEEALVNALIHRDYSFRGANISLFIYSDRVEILSPGGFVPGFNKSDFGKVSIRRNELIADIFSKTKYVEKIGSGIKRMNNLCLEQENPKPVFDVGSFFIIKFPFRKKISVSGGVSGGVSEGVNGGVSEGVSEGVNILFEFIKNNPAKRIPYFEEQLKIPMKTLERWLKKLKDDDSVEFRGSSKTGGYFIKKIK